MSFHVAYVLPEGTPPTDGPQVATNTGWHAWTDWVLGRHVEYPELAHLAQEGWNEGDDALAAMEHECEKMLHEVGDPDLSAIAAQVLSGLRAKPPGAAGIVVTDGEPSQ